MGKPYHQLTWQEAERYHWAGSAISVAHLYRMYLRGGIMFDDMACDVADGNPDFSCKRVAMLMRLVARGAFRNGANFIAGCEGVHVDSYRYWGDVWPRELW